MIIVSGNKNTKVTIEDYKKFNSNLFSNSASLTNMMIRNSVKGKESQDIFLSVLKDESTEMGHAYKKFVNSGFSLGMEHEVFYELKRLLDRAAKFGKWEVDKWKGTEPIVTELLEEFRKDFPEENKEGIAPDLAQLVYIMEKNIHGELETEEATFLEKNMTKWKEQIQMLREQLKTKL